MKKILLTIASIIVVWILGILLIFAIFKMFSYGFEIYEIRECVKWQEQAKEYPEFFSVEWQKDQCSQYDIKIK